MDFKDYYQVLGVDRQATDDEIRKAYRRMARKYHPDVSKEADATARMSEINEANAVLSDPERRQAYDALGQRHGAAPDFTPPPDWFAEQARRRAQSGAARASFGDDAGDTGFSDFFSSLFGHSAGQRRAEQGPLPGADHHARIEVTVAEAYQGGQRTIQLTGGNGQVRTLDVRIPKGVREGQLVRLAGQGMPGLNGGRAGDLYLEIHLQPAADLRVDGRDVVQRLPVAPWEAALGATVVAKTIAGDIEVRIPADSQAGRKLRLRGKGLPGKDAGDLYLELAVVLPPASTPAARRLYEAMASEIAFDPRQGGAGASREQTSEEAAR